MSDALPAHQTKHLPSLAYPILDCTFHLVQSDDGRSHGTALWLAAQILSVYLLTLPLPKHTRPRAVELGSGVGLTALVLSALGYDVLATDIPHVCNSVLRHNIAVNTPLLPSTAGSIQVRELDWNVECDRWQWNDPMRITPTGDDAKCTTHAEDLLPFFRTVQALAAAGRASRQLKPPLLLLALERRDPQFIDGALACAPVPLTQVPTKKVRKVLERAGVRWDTSEWEGVEIWRGTLEV